MKILTCAASLRKDSFNRKLILCVTEMLREKGNDVDCASFSEFEAPLYNGDADTTEIKPPGVMNFHKRLKETEALVLASPEYNFSMPGVLKNLIDWVSRIRPMPWKGARVFLLSASPSMVGGNRGLWALRIPLEACGAFVFPDMFSLAQAHEAFDAQGKLKDPKTKERLSSTLQEFIKHVEI